MNPILARNRDAWDRRARSHSAYVDTALPSDFIDPLGVADPRGWLGGNVKGSKLLCLAAGGGRHGPLFAAAGAEVTVVDLSPAMLELDRKVAGEHGLRLKLVEGSMEDLSSFSEGSFDAVFQPVSSCYLASLNRMYGEVARVLRRGGLYLSQHKQPASLQAGIDWLPGGGYAVKLPCEPGLPLPPERAEALHRESGAMEFLHRLQDLLGGLCKAGFVIEDVVEPKRGQIRANPGSFEHRAAFLTPFLALKARRVLNSIPRPERELVWIPDCSGSEGQSGSSESRV